MTSTRNNGGGWIVTVTAPDVEHAIALMILNRYPDARRGEITPLVSVPARSLLRVPPRWAVRPK